MFSPQTRSDGFLKDSTTMSSSQGFLLIEKFMSPEENSCFLQIINRKHLPKTACLSLSLSTAIDI